MFRETDWQPLCDFFRDEECVRYTIKTPLEDWQTWRMLACYIGHWTMRGYGPYAVVEKSSSELVGAVGLWFPGEWPEPELKGALRRCFWGKGYATEAASAVCDMAQRTLKWKRLISFDIARESSIHKGGHAAGWKIREDHPFSRRHGGRLRLQFGRSFERLKKRRRIAVRYSFSTKIRSERSQLFVQT